MDSKTLKALQLKSENILKFIQDLEKEKAEFKKIDKIQFNAFYSFGKDEMELLPVSITELAFNEIVSLKQKSIAAIELKLETLANESTPLA